MGIISYLLNTMTMLSRCTDLWSCVPTPVCVSPCYPCMCTRAQTPSIGLIIIGIFTFIASLLGLSGAISERRSLVCIYCCIIMLCILLQIGFGFAASQVASG